MRGRTARWVVALLVLCAAHVHGGRRRGPGPRAQLSTTFVYDHVYGEELDAASRAQLKANLDGAVKLYLQSKGKLSPGDLTANQMELMGNPPPPPPVGRGSRAAAHREAQALLQTKVAQFKNVLVGTALDGGRHPATEQNVLTLMEEDEKTAHECYLPVENGGCVTKEAKMNFLENKYIPGKETVYSPLFTVRGHMFQPALAAQVDNDLRMYILSRPKDAVPPAVRQLLMPEGDAQWPGGNTAADNRIPFYPMNTAGQPFYEADIQPLDPAALIPPPPTAPPQPPSDDMEREGVAEQAEDMMLEMLVWCFLGIALVGIPAGLLTLLRSMSGVGSNAHSLLTDAVASILGQSATPDKKAAPNIVALRSKIRSSLMTSV